MAPNGSEWLSVLEDLVRNLGKEGPSVQPKHTMTAREEELTARHLLEHPDLLGVYLKDKRWAEVAALVRYAKRDVPTELAATDPALYRTLREGVTRFFLRGGGILNVEKLEVLATQQPEEPSPDSAVCRGV